MLLNEGQALGFHRQERSGTCEKPKEVHFGMQHVRQKMETDEAISNRLKFTIQEIG